MKSLCRIGTEVTNLPTFDGLNNLGDFLIAFEGFVRKQQRMLALDDSLRATSSRWWRTHKSHIVEWEKC